jgi:hypothetical protein
LQLAGVAQLDSVCREFARAGALAPSIAHLTWFVASVRNAGAYCVFPLADGVACLLAKTRSFSIARKARRVDALCFCAKND